MKLKWVSNVFLDHPARTMCGQSQEEANQHRAEWLRDKVLGEPLGNVAKQIPGAKGVYVRIEEDESDENL
jgi:hypothetical protein